VQSSACLKMQPSSLIRERPRGYSLRQDLANAAIAASRVAS